jgi:phenylpyruvate tautomerase PptA (4-oxalocrotonate tautomerase family)
MPIGYLDVPTGADADRKRALMKAMYGALHEAWPFPDDVRIFLREWPLESVSQNGLLGSEPVRPVLTLHIPQGANVDAKRKVLRKITSAVAEAYQLPDFMTFLVEYPLDLVAHEGNLLADNEERVEDQQKAYS